MTTSGGVFGVMKLSTVSVGLVGLLLWGCAGVPGESGGLQEIPPVPVGFVALDSKQTSFRSAEVKSAEGTWEVNFEGADIIVVTGTGKIYTIDGKWYPEEGGADAALCRGYRKGTTTMIRMEGGNDFLMEESRIMFEGDVLKEVVLYALPGGGQGPEYPGTPVPADKRVTREVF